MAKNKSDRTPRIVFTLYSPFMAVNLKDFKNSKGEHLEVAPVVSLCRCGKSARKPYCDGTHSTIGFVGEKEPDREPDRNVEYKGKDITIVYNRGICAANGACVKDLPDVFRDEEPWIRPDSASVSEITRTIKKCPSGALSYKIGGTRYQHPDQSPAVKIAKNGPLEVVGGIVLHDDKGNIPECREHYTLCRCGGSDNRPFCDGTHLENDFRDDGN